MNLGSYIKDFAYFYSDIAIKLADKTKNQEIKIQLYFIRNEINSFYDQSKITAVTD